MSPCLHTGYGFIFSLFLLVLPSRTANNDSEPFTYQTANKPA